MKPMIRLTPVLILIYSVCFAQIPSASQIERNQEIIEKEKVLMDKLGRKEKKFIKKIIVQGVISFSQDQIKEIILPFQKKWLSEEDIQQIIDSLKQIYRQQGKPLLKITYQIKSRTLLVKVEE